MSGFEPLYFLQGDGEVSKLIRDTDWSRTSLGPVNDWPVALKTTVSTILNSHFPAAIVWGPDYTTIYNDAFRPILGNKPEAMGRPFSEVWHEAWHEIADVAARAYAGEATFIEDFPLRIERFGQPEQAYFTFCYSPLRDDEGRIAGMLDTVIETTAKVETEQHSRMLNAELQHRIKNTLAMVTSIVNQTLRNVPDATEVKNILLQRLAALANTHDILTGTGRIDAAIGDIIAGALAPHDANLQKFTITGPPVRLTEKQAVSLALAVNELTTNSIKYGALSAANGSVRISWTISDGDPEFRFEWKESGGPPVSPPSRKGFGSRLVERVLPADLGGKAVSSYEPDGFSYEVIFAASNLPGRSTA